MFDRLKLMEETYVNIQNKLASGTVDVKEMTSLLKEMSSLEDAVEVYREYKQKEEELHNIKDIIKNEKDPEMLEMAEFEKDTLKEAIELGKSS